MAQPAGIVYSTTIPYTGAAPSGFSPYPIPTVSLVVTDVSGNTYIAGAVASNGLTTTAGVVQPQYSGGTCTFGEFSGPCANAFIAKFNSTGGLVFLTYLGGTGSYVPYGLAVDAFGDIYIGGQTNSIGSPSSFHAGTFVDKLSGDGTALIWSKAVNGALTRVALAPDGSLYYLAQPTAATAYATTLTHLTRNGQLVATGTVPSQTQALAVGADGSVYIGGQTGGSEVTATAGAWQTTFNGGSDGFLAKMNPNLTGYAWLTLVGGNGMDSDPVDSLNLIQPAPDGTLWVSGTTSESTFPVLSGALQSQLSPGMAPNGFLVHLSADGSKALASTYLAAGPLTSLALDGSGNVIFSAVGKAGFQATPGAQWPCQQPSPGEPVPLFPSLLGFFGNIDSAGQHLLWGTWVGPSIPIGPAAVDKNGNAIAAGNVPGQENITLTAMTTVPGTTRLVESCIAESGSPNLSGPLAPGEIFSIYGAGFGPQQGLGAQPSRNTIATQLGGVQVLIEDMPAPLLYVSSVQINLVAPYLLNGRTAAHVKILTADTTSNEVVLGVRPAAPEIFTASNGTAAILNQDGTVNAQNNPAHIGDVVAMFVSGVGQTTPAGVDGSIPQAAGGTPVLPIKVQLNCSFANVTYGGNAPGLVSGATQVNFQIPQMPCTAGAGPPYGALIVLDVGAAASGTIVTFDNNISGDTPYLWFE